MELEKYCDDDDRVRQLINRRARVKELAMRVIERINL